MTHRIPWLALLAPLLLGCQADGTLEGQQTVPGVVDVELEPVDLDVVSAWTQAESYGSAEFIDAQAIVTNQGDYAASFTVSLTMINEAGPDAGAVEGEYKMSTVYVVEPGEEVEIFEGILGGPTATGTCSWQVRVTVADDTREDVNRGNNKASTNTFSVGG